AGRGIEDRAGVVSDEDPVAAEREASVLQRLYHIEGERIAACRDCTDGTVGIVETVLGEACERRLVILGIRAECSGEEQAEGEYERDDAFVRQHFRLFPIPAFESGGGGVAAASKPSRTTSRPSASALVGLGVPIAALLVHPVTDQVLGTVELLRPCVARDKAFSLPHHVEL